jgi:hypothetical protein
VVKGISRQVIVVHAPDQKLFDQAIFILKDDAVGKEGITDEMLLKAADKLLHNAGKENGKKGMHCGPLWACVGALSTGLVWLVTNLI